MVDPHTESTTGPFPSAYFRTKVRSKGFMPEIKRGFNPKKGCEQNNNNKNKRDTQCTILKSNKFPITFKIFSSSFDVDCAEVPFQLSKELIDLKSSEDLKSKFLACHIFEFFKNHVLPLRRFYHSHPVSSEIFGITSEQLSSEI